MPATAPGPILATSGPRSTAALIAFANPSARPGLVAVFDRQYPIADGQTASSTSIYTFVNEHTMTWQSVDHEIAGVQQPDSEVVTIVRQSPAPSPPSLTTTNWPIDTVTTISGSRQTCLS